MGTIRNADAMELLRKRLSARDGATNGEVATYPLTDYEVRTVNDVVQVFKRGTHTTTDGNKLSLGIEEPDAEQRSKLLAKSRTLASVNEANRRFWESRKAQNDAQRP